LNTEASFGGQLPSPQPQSRKDGHVFFLETSPFRYSCRAPCRERGGRAGDGPIDAGALHCHAIGSDEYPHDADPVNHQSSNSSPGELHFAVFRNPKPVRSSERSDVNQPGRFFAVLEPVRGFQPIGA
jgi:hypothetical protein